VAEIDDGDRVLDLGCGCGTNGVFAAQRAGANGDITFLDSNLRATALADHNARTNGVTKFRVIASADGAVPSDDGFDVILANPPYFAVDSIARLFVQRARALLRPNGRFYLVTRQPNTMAPVVADLFPQAEEAENRGYTILIGQTTR
jgi:16S rRNA (guanine1207-N2)-methyltransferase